MAVHEPGSRVIGREGDGQPAATGKQCDVAPSGVIEVQRRRRGGAVKGASAPSEDIEVVT